MIATLNNNAMNQVKTTYMNITPDVASQWLEGNVRNRRIDQRHVDILAQDMAAGKWRLTHQGIAFNDQGMLVDGQHRLWAILQCGCTISMAVSFGLSTESIDAIDGVKARTAVDRMTLSGAFGTEGVTSYHAATLREMVRGMSNGRKLPYHKEVDLMIHHVDAVRFATAHVSTKAKGIAVAYVRAVIARAWYSIDHDQLTVFCRVLSTGMPETACDATIIKLRDQLMAAGGVRNRTIQKELYGKVERVLLHWLNGKTRSVLRPVTAEQFMLPEEVVD
jgi:hypothetical protein